MHAEDLIEGSSRIDAHQHRFEIRQVVPYLILGECWWRRTRCRVCWCSYSAQLVIPQLPESRKGSFLVLKASLSFSIMSSSFALSIIMFVRRFDGQPVWGTSFVGFENSRHSTSSRRPLRSFASLRIFASLRETRLSRFTKDRAFRLFWKSARPSTKRSSAEGRTMGARHRNGR